MDDRQDDSRIDELIRRAVAGDERARDDVMQYIYSAVSAMRLQQLGPFCRDPDYRSEVAVRVMSRFLRDDCRRLRMYCDRAARSFPTLLWVVTNRVAIDLARSMKQNLSGRDLVFRWAVEIEFDEEVHSGCAAPQRHRLDDIDRYLRTRADPLDVKLLMAHVSTRQSWANIGRAHALSPDAARQRVSRLRERLRDWLERRSH